MPSPTSCRTASCCQPRSAAKQRGVVFDVGHGGAHFDYTVAEVAIPPAARPIRSPRYPRLPPATRGPALSDLGHEQVPQYGVHVGAVVAMATLTGQGPTTVAPARHPQVGAPADVSVLEVVEGPVEFRPIRATTSARARCTSSPRAPCWRGVPFGRPYQAPFAVR